ncbi:MAG: EAL domain-containing protein [Lachnospiraceae bacterium]|nr:EAL domain-containing protein [Candidatus Equihabitans merdae]
MERFIAEILALIILFLLAGQRKIRRDRLLLGGIVSAVSAILLNIVCGLTQIDPMTVPLRGHYLLNSAYFLISFLMMNSLAFYIVNRMANRNKEKTDGYRLFLWFVQGIIILMLLVNIKYDTVFHFEEGIYVQGPYWFIGYVMLFVLVVYAVSVYFTERHNVDIRTRRALLMLAPVMIMLAIFQIIYPKLYMNGFMAAVALTVFSIYYGDEANEEDYTTNVATTEVLMRRLKSEPIWRYNYIVGVENLNTINDLYGYRMGNLALYETARALSAPGAFIAKFTPSSFFLTSREPLEIKVPSSISYERNVIPIQSRLLVYDTADHVDPDFFSLMVYANRMMKTNEMRYMELTQDIVADFHHRSSILELLRDDRTKVATFIQPIVNAKTGQVEQAEALVRLYGRAGSLISPAAFVEIAEETGDIRKLGEEVLKAVVDQL